VTFHSTSHSLISVLLSCLYCTTKQRKTAFIYNNYVISSLKKRHIPFCHIERQLIPCFDKTVETILGSILFYQYLLRLSRGHSQRDQCVDVFTVDLFGFYLLNVHSRETCSEMFCKSRREMFNRYKLYLMKKRESTIADFLLFHETCQQTYFNSRRRVLLYSASHKCKSRNVICQSARFIRNKTESVTCSMCS
jgi:hypothetical protein